MGLGGVLVVVAEVFKSKVTNKRARPVCGWRGWGVTCGLHFLILAIRYKSYFFALFHI